ncbi:MAG: lipid-binding SYLF domain-containing protein [Alphaproteobacteria bacterium]|nr:lipid-binding SYLF domain-containing protein [Alphaproteobacteria bacterium]
MVKWFASALAALVLWTGSAYAQAEEQEVVDRARITVSSMLSHPDFREARAQMRRAKGVIVIPSLVKGGFILGGEGGSGVLLVRGRDGSWSNPSFVTMGAGSIGLQIGVQTAEVLFMIMTDKGLQSVMADEFKVGADASIAVGPMGAGVEAGTTANLRADIVSFSRTQGLFGGVSFEGSLIKPRGSWNERYYGRQVSVRDIVIERRVSNPGADALRRALVVN